MFSVRSSVSLVRASALSVRTFASTSTSLAKAAPDMFCMQCEQTEGGKGCSVVGVCGKTPETAGLQDALVHTLKGISMYQTRAEALGAPQNIELDRFTTGAIFSTLTNVNFDPARFESQYIPTALKYRAEAKAAYEAACKTKGVKPENLQGTPATWVPPTDKASLNGVSDVSVLTRRDELGLEIADLHELITYGLKGTCAYAHHAAGTGVEDKTVYADIHKVLNTLGERGPASKSFDTLLGTALKVGEINLRVLEMLDRGHVKQFGIPTPTPVSTVPKVGKAILVSGHDMPTLKALLEQTKGTGINVYTHGEMLPAHGYPELHKYPHLAGNYGGAWQLQKFDFAKFPGPIVMTTNCIIEPRKSYSDRIYTCDMVGWPSVKVVPEQNGKSDFSSVIAQAKSMEGFTEAMVSKGIMSKPAAEPVVGFGHHTILSIADKVIDAVKKGEIQRFFVIGGCDGAETERNYFTDLAVNTPANSVILTLGCGKYRFNRHNFGSVPGAGLPRLLDVGQCNDAYGAVVVASALAKAFNTDINSLPLSFAISWFEQKAVAVLLTLLHLGVKNIHLGPNLPAFVGPELLTLLNSKLGLTPCNSAHPELDLKKFTGAAN